MPRKSQRKGRGGELECAAVARAFGLDAQALGIYEPLDIRINIDNCDQKFEVKTLKNCLGTYYKARKSGAFGTIQKKDYGEWAVTIPYRELLYLCKLLNSKVDKDAKRSPNDDSKSQRIIRRILEIISEENRETDNKGEVGQDNKWRFADTDT